MTIRVKLRTDLKATMRFADKRELDFFRFVMLRIRDDPTNNHPPMSVKDPDGKEAPKLMLPKPITAPQTQSNQAEVPIVVQATPVTIETKPEIRYYTNEDLFKENKMQCCNCKLNSENNTCKRDQPPPDYYWAVNGDILGCVKGEKKQ